jgi:cell division protein FtsI (penicillin-binding protein 3)
MLLKNTRSKIEICAIISLIPVVLIGGKLFYLQAIAHSENSRKNFRHAELQIDTTEPRGKIMDRNGKIIAQSLLTYSCAISKRDVNDKDTALSILSRNLKIPKKDLEEKWKQYSNFFYVQKIITLDEYVAIHDETKEKRISGILLEPQYTRYYPMKSLAADIIGKVGTQNEGLSGLEYVHDGKLLSPKHDENFYDIYLTIDSTIQYFVERILFAAVKKSGAENGFAIVQNPKTGEIISAASYPRNMGKSMPFQWTFEPGSTFKVVTFAAALEEKLIKESDKMFCENGEWNFGNDIVIHDDKEHGELTIPEVLIYSSNICSAKIVQMVGLKKFYAFIRAFGFGTQTSVSFPGESNGIIRPINNWVPLDLAVSAYGHGVSVTGIQMVTAYSAIANGGVLLEPRLIKKLVSRKTGKSIDVAKPIRVRRVISEDVSNRLKKMLWQVVERGTGTQAQIKGYMVAGKTGTSKKLNEEGLYSSEKHVASFAGFLPVSDPQFTILVVIDMPKTSAYGGEIAAPIFADIGKVLLSTYAIKPDATSDTPDNTGKDNVKY